MDGIGRLGALVFAAALFGVTAAGAPAVASPMGPFRFAPDRSEVSIRNHRGGYLPQVMVQVEALNRAGIAARIDGGYCFSACTLFLALDRVCVAPWTRFGFHTPTDPRSGGPLTGPAFEQATRFVAGHFRPALAGWWLREGRHVQRGLALRTGADLIAMGYPACPPPRAPG